MNMYKVYKEAHEQFLAYQRDEFMNRYQNRKQSKQAFMEAKDFPKTTFFERHTSLVVVGIWLFFAVTSTVGSACIVEWLIFSH